MLLLTSDQRESVAVAIVEMYGARLTDDEAAEVIGLVLEDIPGLETIAVADFDRLIVDIRGRYYESANKNSGGC